MGTWETSPHLRESEIVLLVESGYESPEYSSRNLQPLPAVGIWNVSSTDKESGIQYLESGIHGVESRIQDCLGFPYSLHGARNSSKWLLGIFQDGELLVARFLILSTFLDGSWVKFPTLGMSCRCQNPYSCALQEVKFPWVATPPPPPPAPILGQTIDKCKTP